VHAAPLAAESHFLDVCKVLGAATLNNVRGQGEGSAHKTQHCCLVANLLAENAQGTLLQGPVRDGGTHKQEWQRSACVAEKRQRSQEMVDFEAGGQKHLTMRCQWTMQQLQNSCQQQLLPLCARQYLTVYSSRMTSCSGMALVCFCQALTNKRAAAISIQLGYLFDLLHQVNGNAQWQRCVLRAVGRIQSSRSAEHFSREA